MNTGIAKPKNNVKSLTLDLTRKKEDAMADHQP
jgi:hypothetical protein